MKNIWKFSLLGSFFVMFDQLLKGAVQFQDAISNDQLIYFGSYKQVLSFPNWITILLLLISLVYFGYKIVVKRNNTSFQLWSHAAFFTVIFTKIFDLVTVGYFIHYINWRNKFFFGGSEIVFFLAIVFKVIHHVKGSNESNTY